MVPVLSVRNMIASPAVPKFFGKAKIYDVDEVSSLVSAHDKVGWLDVTMDIITSVYKFYS